MFPLMVMAMIVGFPFVSAVADPQDLSATSPAAPAPASLVDGLRSVLLEVLVLLVFLATFSVTRRFMKSRKDVQVEGKGKGRGKRLNPAETADTILDLCQDQFTRALRLYRELVKSDLDKELTEPFYISLIEASVRVNKPDVAEQVVARMLANGMQLSSEFVQSVMKLFAARKLHAEVWRIYELTKPAPHQIIFSCATVAAAETGQVDVARKLLAEARTHFPVSSREWLSIMRHHVRTKDWKTAMADLRALMAAGMPIDNIVFNTVLAACSAAGEELSLQLLDDVSAHAEQHPPEVGATVDIVSYNTLMKALARAGDVEGCFALLERFVARGIEPDDVSFSTLLDVCINEDEHQLASVALERMRAAGVRMNCVVMTTLMKGFVRAHRLDKAMALYESMRAASSEVKPDMITHSMLIKAHCDKSDMATALKILEDMLQTDCCVDDVVFTHLIEGCCQVGNVRLAEKLFSDMAAGSIQPSIYTLNALVKVYGRSGQSHKAFELVARMEQDYGVKPTAVICTCLVSGLLYQKKYADAWQNFGDLREYVAGDPYCTITMLVGLADGQMWAELQEFAEQCLKNSALSVEHRLNIAVRGHASRSRPTTLTESLNYGLNAMLNRSKVQQGRALYKMMVANDVPISVPAADRRLGLVDPCPGAPWTKGGTKGA